MITAVSADRTTSRPSSPVRVPSLQANGVLLRLPIQQAINLGLGVPCLAGMTAAVAMFYIRVQQARKLGKVW